MLQHLDAYPRVKTLAGVVFCLFLTALACLALWSLVAVLVPYLRANPAS